MLRYKGKEYDFGGYATAFNVKCADGLTIYPKAFDDCDNQEVPLIWTHRHDSLTDVIGHGILQKRPKGMYIYGSFNDTENGVIAKALVQHGDLKSLSIYANSLKKEGNAVLHGMIREVSLVHAGANPMAYIDVVEHSGMSDDNFEAIITSGYNIELEDTDDDNSETIEHNDKGDNVELTDAHKKLLVRMGVGILSKFSLPPELIDDLEHAAGVEVSADDLTGETIDGRNVEELFKEIPESVRASYGDDVERIIMANAEDDNDDDDNDSEGENMKIKHNIFDNENQDDVLSHAEFMSIIEDAPSYGSLKKSFLQHGIENIEELYPDYKQAPTGIQTIARKTGWVTDVLGSVHRIPFTKIKTIMADITADEARAQGYVKGDYKIEEVIELLHRTTDPTTIYKTQSFDKDDLTDITDFRLIPWIKDEMRAMLDEELARAILIGDGRSAASRYKIKEGYIRPVMKDEALFAIHVFVDVVAADTDEDIAKKFRKATVRARKLYRGSGNPTMYTTEDIITDMLLIEDNIGHPMYVDEAQVARALRVSKVVSVPVMEGVKAANGGDLLGIMVNLNDYELGNNNGGEPNFFDDFDIDYNKQKYLIETRRAGALVRPYSAIVFEKRVVND